MYRKKALLIINPYAGKMRIRSSLYTIIDELTKGGYTTTVRLTEYCGHATEIARNVQAGEYDIVICSGGDGTLNEVASGIIQSKSDTLLGYIPSGSTNDFASTLGLSKDIQTCAKDIVNGTVHRLDMGRLNDRIFSYVASFGLFTKVSYVTDQTAKNLLGKVAYIIEGMKDLTDVHEQKMIIEADGKIIDDTFTFGAISNSTSLGGIITLDPSDVCLDDGMFEYLFIKKISNVADLLKALNAITSYDYLSDMLYFGSAKKLVFHSDNSFDWSLDGERATAGKDLVVENIHKAISIVLPYRQNALIETQEIV